MVTDDLVETRQLMMTLDENANRSEQRSLDCQEKLIELWQAIIDSLRNQLEGQRVGHSARIRLIRKQYESAGVLPNLIRQDLARQLNLDSVPAVERIQAMRQELLSK